MITLLFVDVRVSPDAATPVVLLREANGPRHLAVWVSAAGGNAILSASAVDDDVPGIHDLMLEALSVLDAVVESVTLRAVTDGVFEAEASINGHAVTCRASDAVALALRCGAPILAPEKLLETAGILLDGEGGSGGDPEEQVEQFREFLDQINADDFGSEP